MASNELPSHLRAKIIELIKQNRKIEAVKVVRETMNWGLAQSKDTVDSLAEEQE